ncbi:hypothetical protein JVT61DRAFT_4617 [Boletus reticuloceps]|uniref:Uncharacterized protein n=1 Tax=Boletus reticuloceps TaxID=495285 RepID=A0A8I3A8Y2_9AGAM|nr:hypothetical protein JVT61DRAFT_4617 [Boletus reticuloceps]
MQVMETNILAKKPRLTHIASEGILIVELPRSAHEVPLSELRGAFAPIIEQMPYDNTLIHPSVEMNLSLKSSSGDFNATPDLSIHLARLSRRRLKPEFVCIGECVFSQDQDTLLLKLQLEVDAHSEVVMVVMIVLTEARPYHSPEEDSTAWHIFRRHSECPSFEEFLDMVEIMDEDSTWLGPVKVAGHTWCLISNVNYHVWVKVGEKKININMVSSGTVAAHGTLFPEIDMDTVDVVIHQGLLKIRDAMIQFNKRLDPQADTSLLEVTDVLWDFNWSRCQARIVNAAKCTAHEHFEDWYSGCFRGTKHSIEDVDTSGNFDTSAATSQSSDSSQTSLSPKAPPLTRARSRVMNRDGSPIFLSLG